MYKELIISIIIIVGIFTFDYALQQYTKTSIDKTTDELSMIKQDLEQNNVNHKEVLNKVNATHDRWTEYNDKLVYFIEHNELEKVETCLMVYKSYVETNQYDFAIAEIEKASFILDHIKDKYSFNLENIF